MDGLKCIADRFAIHNFWDTNNTKETNFSKPCKYKKEDWDCYQDLRKSKTKPQALFLYSGQANKYYALDDNGQKTDDYLEILSPTKQLIAEANPTRIGMIVLMLYSTIFKDEKSSSVEMLAIQPSPTYCKYIRLKFPTLIS